MKKRGTEKRKMLRFLQMQTVIAAFVAMLVVISALQRNVRYESADRILVPLSEEAFSYSGLSQEPECLVVWEDDESGTQGRELMDDLLSQMKIPFEMCQGSEFEAGMLEQYDTVVVSVTHLNILGEGLLDMMDWVERGGNFMLLYPPEANGALRLIADKLGINDMGSVYAVVEGLHFQIPFMLGAQRDYTITDPFESSLSVSLNSDCEVYLVSDAKRPTPLIWRREVGEGVIVVDNLGFLEKAYRGIHCAAYSLLGDHCVYPVINGSAFYIDDFPSPVPDGEGECIQRDYGISIKEFYTQVWWKDICNLAKKHGMKYTGLVIEEYSDHVKAPYDRNHDTKRYRYFGNMLLDLGGEIGFHGYNHMPLCLQNFDYQGGYDSYKKWKSYEDMREGIEELSVFCSELFPEEKFQVYVPPSNILSEEGKQMLRNEFPQIRAVASVYLGAAGDVSYVQEYEVSEDGMIETPRIIAGYMVDDYMQLTAMAELNFHFVNSHFQHPDDVLDEDRGAFQGWNKLYSRISEYTDWLYETAPDIRNLTGIEMAGAVQRYDYLSVSRTKSEDHLTLKLYGFADEAWLMVRINEGIPGAVTGGTMTKLLDGLYLLKAEADEVSVEIRQAKTGNRKDSGNREG